MWTLQHSGFPSPVLRIFMGSKYLTTTEVCLLLMVQKTLIGFPEQLGFLQVALQKGLAANTLWSQTIAGGGIYPPITN